MHPQFRASGFTLIEAVVVVAIIVVIAGVVGPLARSMVVDARVTKILSVWESLKEPCERFYIDTGIYATENTGPTTSPNWSAPSHQLSMDDGTPGWDGPYIDRPLTFDDNPLGDRVAVSKKLNYGPASGFKLEGEDFDNYNGNGSMLRFWGITPEIAEEVDARVDINVQGAWETHGLVMYYPDDDGQLYLFIQRD